MGGEPVGAVGVRHIIAAIWNEALLGWSIFRFGPHLKVAASSVLHLGYIETDFDVHVAGGSCELYTFFVRTDGGLTGRRRFGKAEGDHLHCFSVRAHGDTSAFGAHLLF